MGKVPLSTELTQEIDSASAVVLRDVIKTIGTECPDGRVMAKEMLASAPEHVRRTRKVLANVVRVVCEGVEEAKGIAGRVLEVCEVMGVERNMVGVFGSRGTGMGRRDMFAFSGGRRRSRAEFDDVPASSSVASVKRRKVTGPNVEICEKDKFDLTKGVMISSSEDSRKDETEASILTRRSLPPARKKTIDEIFTADAQRRESEALKEEQRVKAESEWAATRTRCGRCNMEYYPDYNRDGDCVWHSGALRPFEDWAERWNCCGSFDDEEGCRQSEHVDGSIPGVMRTLESRRLEAEEEGDWQSAEDECCSSNSGDDDSDDEGAFLREYECDDCSNWYMGREPTPDKDFAGVPRCRKCQWKADNFGWEDADSDCFRCTESSEARNQHDATYYVDVAVCDDCKVDLSNQDEHETTSRHSANESSLPESLITAREGCDKGLAETAS